MKRYLEATLGIHLHSLSDCNKQQQIMLLISMDGLTAVQYWIAESYILFQEIWCSKFC